MASQSNSLMGSWDSRAKRGMCSFLMMASRSTQGEYTLSHHTPSNRLNISYRIWIPRWDMPISYTSGKQKAMRMSTSSLFFTTALTSPPMYLAGFSTFIKISSDNANLFILNPSVQSISVRYPYCGTYFAVAYMSIISFNKRSSSV